MTEEEAKHWVARHYGDAVRTTLERFVSLLLNEAEQQNLISVATRDQVWGRHIVDSLQLLALGTNDGAWLDIGTGGGMPGMVLAIADPNRAFVLCEPREKRATFLADVVDELSLDAERVTVAACTVERLTMAKPASVISARAVDKVEQLFAKAKSVSTRETVWVLPRGRGAQQDKDDLVRQWHGVFHVEQSLTSDDAGILVARKVRRK